MKRNNLVLLGILIIGLFFRFVGNNWDQGWHLHPDERFLTMVGTAVQIPSSIDQYLDQRTSSFNPVNKGHAFYVYGTFPILLNKVLAQYYFNDTYDQFNLQGRMLSGIADLLIVFILFKLVELWEKRLKLDGAIKYITAFLYAISVLPIQLSHFFTVDTFLNLCAWGSVYFATRIVIHKDKKIVFDIVISGLLLGLAFACKVSAIYVAPLIGAIICIGVFRIKGPLTKKIFFLSIFCLFLYLAARFGSPYYFETNNIGDLRLSSVFLNNIKTLKSFDNPQQLYPPGVQWLSKNALFPLTNIIFFGIGPIYFLCAICGAFILLKKNNPLIFLFIVWAFGFTMYLSAQFSKTMRYFIFIYPLLALCAAVAVNKIVVLTRKLRTSFRYPLSIFLCCSLLYWPLAFMSIYTKDHSRVEASKWIYANVPSRSSISYEYWDDPLPLSVQDPMSRSYVGQEIHIFDKDSSEKWNTITTQLKKLDYYIMSSNRGWGSIQAASGWYPVTSKFYNDMFQNKRGFTLIKEFASYPSLRYLGIPIDFPDQWAEEAFTVYDHPLVTVFKKQ